MEKIDIEKLGVVVIRLKEIAKGEGEFSRDPITHAINTIENMKRLAKEALEILKEDLD